MGIFGFGKKQKIEKYDMVDLFDYCYSPFGDDILKNNIVRSSIDYIANAVAKSEVTHTRPKYGTVEILNSNIIRILTEPNFYQTKFTFLYRLVSELYINNNAFVYIEYDEKYVVKNLHILDYDTIELLEKEGILFAKFYLTCYGTTITVPYENLIHIRRHYNSKVFYADSSNKSLLSVLETNSVIEQGIVNVVKLSSLLKLIMKFTGVFKQTDMDSKVEEFRKSINSKDGIAGMDAKAELIPLKFDPKLIDHETIKTVKGELYGFFGVSEALINGTANESEVQNFYDQVITPILVQLAEEFTKKLFSQTEKGYGNKIVFTSQSMMFASLATKTTLIKELMQLGVMNINESRAILGMSPLSNGDRRLQSLNFVNQEIVDSYQLSKVVDGNTSPVTNNDLKGGDNSDKGQEGDENS